MTNTRIAWFGVPAAFGMVCALALGSPAPAAAQTTISTGSIQGTISDPSDAVVPGAAITITNKATGQSVKLTATATGTYNSGGLIPAVYSVKVEASGFKTTEAILTVQVGVTTPANFKLEVGAASTVVTVQENSIAVNTEQHTVQAVLTREQIDTLPVNGRNFLDLAQLEPGVQIQDGANFDPTKNGYSSISFGGRFGRTARIEVDGIDISDETAGTTTANIPASAIQEFQLSSSSLDLSTELTSSGAVNVTTRSGTNEWHGDGFWYGRNDSLAAKQAPGTDVPFFRHQYGADFGGPILKNKLFFFGDFERTRQDEQTAVVPAAPFTGLAGSYSALFRDLAFLGRVDWQIKPNWNLFARFNDEQNRDVVPFIPNTFNPFLNVDYEHAYIVGTDFYTGRFSHSIRFGVSKFHNSIADAVTASGAFNPAPGIAVTIGGALCLGAGADSFCSGANTLAPQGTFQQNMQIKYDGSRTIRSHIVRYGFGFDRIQGGGFAAFIGLQGIANNSSGCNATCLVLPGGASNPLNYTVDHILLGNGQGFFSEKPAFGLPAGGVVDNRIQWYLGDTWKIKPNFSFNYGVRYVRDTGRTDADLPPIPCSAAPASAFPVTPCVGSLLDNLTPGLGKAVNQPNSNYGGNVGFAWDPMKNGKTVIRAGAGIYYENILFNNILFDRPTRLPTGLFWSSSFVCPGGLTLPNGTTVTTVNGTNIATSVCGQPIGAPGIAADVAALETMYQQATKAAGAASNGSYLGNTLAGGANSTGNSPFSSDYVSPYSFQANIGFQRELFAGTVFQMDYVRNLALHYLLVEDANHVGDASTLNTISALNAIGVTDASFMCPGTNAAAINCAIIAGATMASYQGNGLDSGNSLAGGFPCGFLPVSATVPAATPACAFAGKNPSFGQMQVAYPAGRAVYNGLQMSLKSQKKNLLPGIRNSNFIVSYAYSRYIGQMRDIDFIFTNAADFRNPNKAIGPTGLDRTNQFSAGGVFDLPWATEIGFVTHYYTALPVTLYLPGGGTIFTTDVTGDGSFNGDEGSPPTQGDILPGTNIGSLNRNFGLSGLNKLITAFNTNYAGKPTPAGGALVNAGLFTPAQLTALGATIPAIAPVVPGAISTSVLFTFDTSIGWNIHPGKFWKWLPERVLVHPQMTFYNLFNRQNYDSPSLPPNGILTPLSACPTVTAPTCVGAVNTTTRANRTNLTGLGSGVYALGAPRQLEWGVKVSF